MSGINEQWSVIYTFKSTVGWSVDWRGNSSQYPASMIAATIYYNTRRGCCVCGH